MPRSMTGFGRYYLEEDGFSQTWEVRSVNSRFLDLKWRLPYLARGLEPALEKVVRKHAARGRVEISLNLQFTGGGQAALSFKADQAAAMLEELRLFAQARGDDFVPDYNRLLGLSSLWEDSDSELAEELAQALGRGLELALEDWNEARAAEGKSLERDIMARAARMEEWGQVIEERGPEIKEERFASLRGRLSDALEALSSSLDESRFLQEVTILADKLDVSEELTRLQAHLERFREIMQQSADAGRRLDFTIQEIFREINTCGNKIQDTQISRIIVDFKNELEKCREQVQNME
ncbi:MAG: YicC family protein [Deltaproteobacteria bacterium]|nr:YicC family protein [Deltaproteobacteria bacterium]